MSKWEDRIFMALAGLLIMILLAGLGVGYLAYNKASIESTCNIKISWKQALLFNSQITRCPVGGSNV